MIFQTRDLALSLLVAALVAAGGSRVAAQMADEDAWKALPTYEYGQDMAAILTIDRAVIQAMASPAARSACAARLAAILEADETTPAARQYVCFQLRQVGTPAEVPVLARLLGTSETSEMARYALEAIPGEASSAAMRGALATMKGDLLVGVIHSLAARKDVGSVAALERMSESSEEPVRSAALWALGNIAGDEAANFLRARAEKAGMPTPQNLALPLLRCADALAAAGKTEEARAISEELSQAGQAPGVRRAALGALLRLEGEGAEATELAWFAGEDADRRVVAAGQLGRVSEEQLDNLATRLADLPDPSKLTLIEVLASRRGKETLPLVMSLVASEKPELKLAGIRCLGMVGDRSAIPLLIETLSAGGELTEATGQALVGLPRKEVNEALLDALDGKPESRVPVIEVLTKLKCYEAIDPLIAIAARTDPAEYGPALDGLRGIADPDKTDVPRLVKLLLGTPRGKHRDEVEKTLLIVCDKLPQGADRAGPVLDALSGVDPSEAPEYLPLLGRLGGPKALGLIESALAGSNPEVQEAAVRALCNWPNAEVADRLLDIASSSQNRAYRQWALRAYVRVVSLPSDRPEAKTLAMLQEAMKLAQTAEDKRLVLERASTVRTMEAVSWIAGHLDDPALAQAACQAIVELAHHRFLRQPNMDRFGPILEKVSQTSNDPAVVERAKRYRLGL
ncbi:MAG: HEAT repeat domain-containing protein [Planctomycetota bacterium]